LVFQKRWCGLCWRWWMLMKSVNKPNRWKCGTSLILTRTFSVTSEHQTLTTFHKHSAFEMLVFSDNRKKPWYILVMFQMLNHCQKIVWYRWKCGSSYGTYSWKQKKHFPWNC
jgi:hypothetical protein